MKIVKSPGRLCAYLSALAMVLFATDARADNCGGLADCFNTMQWAAIAIVAVIVVALAVEFLPALIVGATEGGAELGELTALGEEGAGTLEAAGTDLAAEEAAIPGAEAAADLGAEAAGAGQAGGAISDLGLPDLNAVGGTTNCAQCVQSLESWFGNSPSGLPSFAADIAPSETTMGDLETNLGGNWSDWTSFNDVTNWMRSAGEGSRGVVYVWDGSSPLAHVLNVVNINGAVIGVDTQIGAYGGLDTIASFAKFVRFLPTFP